MPEKMIHNRRLILPYAGPYFAYVAIASILGEHLSVEMNYTLRLIVVTSIIVLAWRWYCPIKGPNSPLVSTIFGIFAGLIGVFVWIVLLAPFVHQNNVSPWSNSAFMLRLLSAGVLVPIFEELMMRGFILRLALQWDNARKNREKDALYIALNERSVNDVKPGAWSWAAIAISTTAFTSGHQLQEWPAAMIFGLLMTFLWVLRKDLLTCIVAHAFTNVALAFYVFKTGSWHYW